MRTLYALLIAATCTGCATMADPDAGVKSLGGDQYSISEMGVIGGSLPERAAKFCGTRGKKMKVEGNTTQTGLASGTSYPVLIFSCRNAWEA
ncbi:hypothetical protein [Sphingomonas aquatilis]